MAGASHSFVPPIFLGTCLLILIVFISVLLGHRLLRLVQIDPSDATERLALSAGLGLGVLQLLPYTLFALGAARPFIFRATTLVLALVLLPELRQLAARLREAAAAPRPWPAPVALATIIVAGLAALVYLRSVCPVTDADGLTYHLTAPVRYLQAGRFVFIPTITPTNWPLGMEMLFALLLGVHPDSPPCVVTFLCGALTVVTVYLAGRQIGGARQGDAAVLLLLAYPLFWWEMASAHIDLGTTLFSTLALYALMRSEPGGRWLRLAAVFAGLAATTKMTGVWVILAFALVICLAPSEHPIRARMRQAAGFAGIALLALVPWFAKSWVLAGNPVYPALYGLFGGREWTAAGWQRFHEYHLLFNVPPGMPPTMRVLTGSHLAILAAGSLLSRAVFRATRHWPAAAPLRFAVLVVTFVPFGSYFNPRFMLAAFPALAVGLAGPASRLRKGWAAAGCALAVALTIHIGIRRLQPDLPTAASVAFGFTPREDYLRRAVDDYALAQQANRIVPEHDRILISSQEQHTAIYRASALLSNYWLQDSIHFDDEARLFCDLRRLDVKYLVMNPVDEAFCRRSYECARRDSTEFPALARLAATRGKKLAEANGFALYQLDLSAKSEPPRALVTADRSPRR